jgi:hypothetical protein
LVDPGPKVGTVRVVGRDGVEDAAKVKVDALQEMKLVRPS